MIPAMHRHRRRFYCAEVALPASSVKRRIAVKRFFPHPSERYANLPVGARYRSEITHKDNRMIPVIPVAQKADNATLTVIAINPLKAPILEIVLKQRRFGSIESIQIPHPSLQPGVIGLA